MNNTYAINSEEGKNYKCVYCGREGGLVYSSVVEDESCEYCGCWQNNNNECEMPVRQLINDINNRELDKGAEVVWVETPDQIIITINKNVKY